MRESMATFRKKEQLFSFVRAVNCQSTAQSSVNGKQQLAESINPLSQQSLKEVEEEKVAQNEGRVSHFKSLQQSLLSYLEKDVLKSNPSSKLIQSLRIQHSKLQQFISNLLTSFQKDFYVIFQKISIEMNKVVEERDLFKQKYSCLNQSFKNIQKENQLLKMNLEEWEQAKERRKTRQSQMKQERKEPRRSYSTKKSENGIDKSSKLGHYLYSEEKQFSRKNSVELQQFPESVLKTRDNNILQNMSSSKMPSSYKRNVKSSCSSFANPKNQKINVISMFNMM